MHADFSASIEFKPEASNSPRRIPQIDFTGSVVLDDDRVRVEVTNSITQEPSVALLDISGGTATLLYPDNLNGERMPLGDDFRSGYLSLFREFALGSKLGEVKGWKLQTSSGDDGETIYNYSGSTERTVSFRIGGKNGTRELLIDSPKVMLRILLGEITLPYEVSATEFSVPDGFAMRDSETNLADILPSL